MPNLDTHAHLAMTHYPEGGVEFAAGEVFEDMVKMAGGECSNIADGSLFYRGTRSNNAVTDPAFDAQPPLRQSIKATINDLEQANIPQSLHRRCANIGTDILFSGVDQQRAASSVAYLEVCDFLKSSYGQDLVARYAATSQRSNVPINQVRSNVHAIASHGLRAEYTDPAYVVERLKLVLARRPRLAFPADFDQTEDLAAVFAAQQNRLASVANDIYSGTLSTITGEPMSIVNQRFDMPNLPVVPYLNSIIELSSTLQTPALITDWQGVINRESLACTANTTTGRQNFAASRAAAHFLLQHIAHADTEFTISDPSQRIPRFPENWLGSITHSERFAAAAIANTSDYKSIGIDIAAKNWHFDGSRRRQKVLTPHELTLSYLEDVQTRTIMSMKEAIFKAVHPLIVEKHPKAFWFRDVEVSGIDLAASKADVRMSGTERSKKIATILGDVSISCFFLENDWFSSAVCVVN